MHPSNSPMMLSKSSKTRMPLTLAPAPDILVEGVESGTAPIDKYTAGIELSNACRQFYVSRVKASAKVKERLGIQTDDRRSSPPGRGAARPGTGPAPRSSRGPAATPTSGVSSSLPQGGTTTNEPSSTATSSRPATSIDSAMQVLKREMASLIDQDLALMGQLLTLNDQIEELKWQRKLRGYCHGGSSMESSCYLDTSAYSMCTSSEACMMTTSNLDVPDFIPKYPSPSELSLFSDPSPLASREADLPGNQGSLSLLVPEVVPTSSHHTGRNVSTSGFQTTSTSDLGSTDDLPSSGRSTLTRKDPTPMTTPWEGRGSRQGLPGTGGGGRDSQHHLGGVVPYHSRGSQDQQSFDSGIHDPEPGALIEIML